MIEGVSRTFWDSVWIHWEDSLQYVTIKSHTHSNLRIMVHLEKEILSWDFSHAMRILGTWRSPGRVASSKLPEPMKTRCWARATPSWKIWVNWDDNRNPINMGKCKIHGNQTTNQKWMKMVRFRWFRCFSRSNVPRHTVAPRLHHLTSMAKFRTSHDPLHKIITSVGSENGEGIPYIPQIWPCHKGEKAKAKHGGILSDIEVSSPQSSTGRMAYGISHFSKHLPSMFRQPPERRLGFIPQHGGKQVASYELYHVLTRVIIQVISF